MEYTYTIIDSDATSNLQLQHYLEEYGDFTCAGLAQNSSEGTNIILKYFPDVVFVNLTENAYEYFHMVMELHQYINELPIIIGISKNKKYAYDAIKNGFFDYWLKPYNEFEIRKSILRLKKRNTCQNRTSNHLFKVVSRFSIHQYGRYSLSTSR
ncbi:LytR/AlgR family response regulator transcription factor [Zobellia nedashkovskayae]